MTPEQFQSLEALLWGMACLLVAANLGLALWRTHLRLTTGTPRQVVLSGRKPRRLYLAGIALVALLVLFARIPVAQPSALVVLVAAALLLLRAPGERDSVLGTDGVQYGWHARRFPALEEWRLTGDHLRWRLQGEWVSSDVPAALHADLRVQLASANPDRESRFQR